LGVTSARGCRRSLIRLDMQGPFRPQRAMQPAYLTGKPAHWSNGARRTNFRWAALAMCGAQLAAILG
jgi:hypothetical protein